MKLDIVDLSVKQDLMIVKLYKPAYRKVEQTVLDEEKNKGKDPKKDIMALKKITEKVLMNFQTVEVMAINTENRLDVTVGDVVLVDWRKGRECDAFKNSFIFNTYEVIGKINLE